MTDIVERLREPAICSSSSSGIVLCRNNNRERKEAADEIERLQQQNAELLAALENIANGCLDCKPYAHAAIEKAKC